MFLSMFIFSILNFFINRKHLLMTLLSLELVILTLFMMMYFYLSYFSYEFYFVVVFLTMSVCESVLGLSLLVSMIRSYGNDYFNSLNILW
uniref:NADH-ubiquinone oxidoreductase chain 4L n=1 Tax=Harmonia axyridis TaxID=115357 RepID=A0A1W5YJV7_HARAX|nr:NADH dehydrogenase subunit 4L [Harmonia axyridis]ARI43906.1 NADH dehydrogenase subunit 4L [Harmonia axyridis]